MHTIQLVDTQPDSALSILNGMDRSRFSNEGKALYALAYTIAQDKSGLDVDDDSLVRVAYNHFRTNTKDKLYGRCMYYMGKYYMQTDSIEQAMTCFRESLYASEVLKDTAYQCLALEKQSSLERVFDIDKAIKDIDRALSLYKQYHAASVFNTIYFSLEKAECLSLSGRGHEAVQFSKDLIDLAFSLGDSTVISDVYQDMSIFLQDMGENQLACQYVKLACQYAPKVDATKVLALATGFYKIGDYDNCIKTVKSHDFEEGVYRYTAFSLLHHAATMQMDQKAILTYADSAYISLEALYEESLEKRDNYYTKLIAEREDKAYANGKISEYRWAISLIFIATASLLALLYLMYRMKQKTQETRIAYATAKIEYEHHLRIKEKAMMEEINRRELEHKEFQLDLIRKYLIRKIDILDKLQSLKANSEKHLTIEEKDWEELEVFLEHTQDGFVTKIKQTFPALNTSDYRYLMLLRIGLPSKSLSNIYGISEKSIKQRSYLYKSKLGIANEKRSLRKFLEDI